MYSCYQYCVILIFWTNLLFAQKYNFIPYSVEEGLVQSQAMSIAEDAEGYIWAATLGGASRFDGKHFEQYTRSEGLLSNFTLGIFSDAKRRIWLVSQNGISRFDGQSWYNFPIKTTNSVGLANAIAEDNQGSIWFTHFNFKAFFIQDTVLTEFVLPDDPAAKITTLATDKHGNLIIAVYKKGIFKKIGEVLQPLYLTQWPITKLFFDRQNRLWLLTTEGVFCENNKGGFHKILPGNFKSIAEDKHDNIWFGAVQGAWQWQKDGKTVHFTAKNGFTDQAVEDILCDKEGNVWFATDGAGIIRFSGRAFTYFDQTTGLPNPSVMTMALETPADENPMLWLGTNGGGLCRFDGQRMETVLLPSKDPHTKQINIVHVDKNKRLWVGTNNGGLWRKEGAVFRKMPVRMPTYTAVASTESATYFGTPAGLLRFKNERFEAVQGIKNFVGAIACLPNDSVLTGTSQGLFLLCKDQVKEVRQPVELTKSLIMALEVVGNYCFIATADDGLWVWNRTTNQFTPFRKKEGLPANHIFSLIFDKQTQTLWAGTVNGICSIRFSPDYQTIRVKKFGKDEGGASVEANQNAVLRDGTGCFWFGTVKGVFRYHPTDAPALPAPSVFIRRILLFSNPIPQNLYSETDHSWHRLPLHLALSPDQNHLSFEFSALNFAHQAGLRYQYYLDGLEKKFSAPTEQTTIIYPVLPSGTYVFRVKAVNMEGIASPEAVFKFSIKTPFYRTVWFRLLAVLSVLLLGLAIRNRINRQKERHKQQLEAIRLEEQHKIRKRTAEDFHDEMGNKLTRIAVLTEMIGAKTNGNLDLKSLLQQIRENTQALYAGTRDLIWALNPGHDNLYEVLERLRDFGIGLFSETTIDFEMTQLPDNFKKITLPMDYNRHVMMIVKEALNNVLRHSGAQAVYIDVEKQPDDSLKITIQDNGTGFDIQTVKRGSGINNMQTRVQRMGATLMMPQNVQNCGTSIVLTVKIPLST